MALNLVNKFLFVADHQGPYLSIEPLQRELDNGAGRYLLEGLAFQHRTGLGLPCSDLQGIESLWGGLQAFLLNSGVKAVIRSTSEDTNQRTVEHLASVAAGQVGLPVFVVEDFPGNYRPSSDERLDALFVEGADNNGQYMSRGISPQLVFPTGNPRYDSLGGVDRNLRRAETRKSLGLDGGPVALWAGQPDGDNSYRALERVLDRCAPFRFSLLFRAHPRDQAYLKGKYETLFDWPEITVIDVTSYPDNLDLCCCADVVLTQFSSAGVEASYVGVPSVFVLFDDLAKDYLRANKGYETLPWCEDDCSFLIENEQDVRPVLARALFDHRSRSEVKANFARRFPSDRNAGKAIAQQINELMAGAYPAPESS